MNFEFCVVQAILITTQAVIVYYMVAKTLPAKNNIS